MPIIMYKRTAEKGLMAEKFNTEGLSIASQNRCGWFTSIEQANDAFEKPLLDIESPEPEPEKEPEIIEPGIDEILEQEEKAGNVVINDIEDLKPENEPENIETDQGGEISNDELREMAKNAGIENYKTAHFKTLKKQLGV